MKEKNTSEDKKRIIIFTIIVIVCVLAIVEAVYVYIFSPDGTIENVGNINVVAPEEDKTEILKEQFNTIFKNDLTSNIDTTQIPKKDNKYNLIYTDYEKVERVTDEYELDVQIPHINIDTSEVSNINNEIDKMFKVKAESIINEEEPTGNTVYNVKYKAYINNDILSLIIECTLKEKEATQRIIIKTYTYNLKTEKISENKTKTSKNLKTEKRVTFDEIAKMKNITKKEVEDKIKQEIDSQILMEQSLKEAGYTVFNRYPDSEMYKYDNISSYFLDNENNLYVVFAYGNTNNTSEVDLVIF